MKLPGWRLRFGKAQPQSSEQACHQLDAYGSKQDTGVPEATERPRLRGARGCGVVPEATISTSILKESLGTFLFTKLPQHDRVRFEAALSVQQRAAAHAGSAMQPTVYQHHLHLLMEAEATQDQKMLEEAHAAHAKTVTKQASAVRRRLQMACASEKTTWKRNQGRGSMMRSSIKLPDLTDGKVTFKVTNAAQGPHAEDPGGQSADADDWLSQHTRHQQAAVDTYTNNPSFRTVLTGPHKPAPGLTPAAVRAMGGSEATNWVHKTRTFMQGVVGKLKHSEPHPETNGATKSKQHTAQEHNDYGGDDVEVGKEEEDEANTLAAEPQLGPPARSWHSAPKLNPSQPRSASLTPEHGAGRSNSVEPRGGRSNSVEPRGGRSHSIRPGAALPDSGGIWDGLLRPRAASTIPWQATEAASSKGAPVKLPRL